MITKYGLPQAAVFPGIAVCGIVVLVVFFGFAPWAIPIELILFAALVWALSFFRDPRRDISADDNALYSPCDGTVTDAVTDGGSVRVSMFLSIFNVHLNRSPCRASVNRVTYKKGQFRDARDPESAKVNESNEIELSMLANPGETVIVRQVSGAVARRIVCKAKTGGKLEQGERFGMIKFGSRTELIVSGGADREICVKPGDKVKAGLTVLIRYANKGEPPL